MSNTIGVKIKILNEKANIPKYATEGSAACDLTACIEEQVTIERFSSAMIPTGIAIAPERNDVVALVYSRSGMGCKHGISLSNSVGVIDSDYRGEIKVSLYNGGTESYTVNPGDRIAQLMFVPIYTASFEAVDNLEKTERGESGFGSSGK